MVEKELDTLNIYESIRKTNSTWYKLRVNIFNSYLYKNALRIRTMWLRDQWSFRTKVMA